MAFQRLRPLTDYERKTYELSKAVETSFTPRPLNLEGINYLPFQNVGIEFGSREGNILLGDEPGVGKTIQAIGICNEIYAGKILVVCPAKLINVWVTHLKRWLIGTHTVGIFHPKNKNTERVLVSSIYFSGQINGVRDLKKLGPWDVLILDEAHLYKELKTNRTKLTYAKNGLIASSKKVIAVSGTAIVNRPMELYSTIKALKPEALGGMNKFGFGVRYCAGWSSPWGWDFSGASNLKELGLALRASGFMVRRRKADVLTDLPPKFNNVVFVEKTKSGDLALKQLEDMENVGKLKENDLEFTDASRVRRELGLSKIDFAVEYIKTLLESGHKKIIVFAHHKEVIRTIHSKLDDDNIGCVEVTGITKNEDVEKVVHAFQTDDKYKIFLGSIQASGVGLTLTAASYVVFVEFSWVPGENSQASDRAHRVGQKSSVVVDYLVYRNTIDERILKRVLEKEKAMGELYE